MPTFVAAIGGMLINLVGTLVGRVLVALGIGVATFTGVNATLDALRDQAVSAIGGLPPEIAGALALMKVGIAISIITSAITARMLLDGLTGDTFKRWIHK